MFLFSEEENKMFWMGLVFKDIYNLIWFELVFFEFNFSIIEIVV